MQPLPPIPHQIPPYPFASLALRQAQRAFAPLLEANVGDTTFRFAQLRGAARRGLSVLSADDRVHLARWLALLRAATGTDTGNGIGLRVARVDAALGAAVEAACAEAGATIVARRERGAVAA